MTIGWVEQPEYGPRCFLSWFDGHESAVGRMEQLADVGF